MPEATLSAWYDHELSSDLDARVQSHVANCRACQTYLDDFEATRRTLRQDRPPEMQSAIWGDVRGRIDPAKPGTARVPSRRPLIAGGLAAAGAIALLFAVILAFTTHGTTSVPTSSTSSSTLSATATGTQHATPTHTASETATPGAVLAVTQNWQTAKGVPNGVQVAFSSTAPRTGYACAITANDNKTPLHIYITQDGGATWQQPAPASIDGVLCQFTINPMNPADVTMLVSVCLVGCGDNNNLSAYRTVNGGQSWSQLMLPSGSENGYDLVGQPYYAGDALFVLAAAPGLSASAGPSAKHSVAISINAQPFAWLDLTSVVGADTFTTFIAGNVFCVYDAAKNILARTTNAGATWTKGSVHGISPQAINGYLIQATPSSSTIYLPLNNSSGGTLEISTDGGLNWQSDGALPTGQQSAPYFTVLAVTPDGTLYVTDVYEYLWRRSPGATTWQQISVYNGNTYRQAITVSWSAAGHPAAVWAYLLTFHNSNTTAYLQYRAP